MEGVFFTTCGFSVKLERGGNTGVKAMWKSSPLLPFSYAFLRNHAVGLEEGGAGEDRGRGKKT